MKNLSILALSLSALLLVSCSSEQKKTEKLVASYLKENLKDPSSYESISFSEIDSTLSKHTDEQVFKDIMLNFDAVAAQIELTVYDESDAKTEEEKAKIVAKRDSLHVRLSEVAESGKKFRENYKPYFNGYKAIHKYRAKNGFGAFDVYEQEFYTNKDISEIVESKKIE